MDVSDKETLLELRDCCRGSAFVPDFILNGIGFTGQKGSGKDTAAEMLVEILGSNEFSHRFRDIVWQKFAFATALKRMCSDGFGIPPGDLDTQEGKMKFNGMFGMTNRKILQSVGDGMRDAMGEDVWIRIVKNGIMDFKKLFMDGFVPKGMAGENHDIDGNTLIPKYPFFIVTDIRYPNEAKMVLGMRGIVIRVVRDETDVKEPEHRSEIPLDGQFVTETVMNNGTLDDLRESMLGIVGKYVFPGEKSGALKRDWE